VIPASVGVLWEPAFSRKDWGVFREFLGYPPAIALFIIRFFHRGLPQAHPPSGAGPRRRESADEPCFRDTDRTPGLPKQ
jgi:hypothetical protein